MNERSVRDVLNLYNPANPLEKAFTIPAPWYFDKRIEELERNSVFAANWQVVGRLDQVQGTRGILHHRCERRTADCGSQRRRHAPHVL